MEREAYFWNAMETLSQDKKSKTPITRSQLDTIYDMLVEFYNDIWQAGNFVKLCTHLKSCTVEEVARAALDLKKNNFDYENTIGTERKRTVTKPEPKRHSFFYDFSSARSRGRVDNVVRYPSHQISGGTPAMESFLSAHFIDLTPQQRKQLSSLRPGSTEKQELAPV